MSTSEEMLSTILTGSRRSYRRAQDAVRDEVQVGVGLLEEAFSRGCQGEEAAIDVLPKFVLLRFAKAGAELAHGWVYMFLTSMRSTYSHNEFHATSWFVLQSIGSQDRSEARTQVYIHQSSPHPSPRGRCVAPHITLLLQAGRMGHVEDIVSKHASASPSNTF